MIPRPEIEVGCLPESICLIRNECFKYFTSIFNEAVNTSRIYTTLHTAIQIFSIFLVSHDKADWPFCCFPSECGYGGVIPANDGSVLVARSSAALVAEVGRRNLQIWTSIWQHRYLPPFLWPLSQPQKFHPIQMCLPGHVSTPVSGLDS